MISKDVAQILNLLGIENIKKIHKTKFCKLVTFFCFSRNKSKVNILKSTASKTDLESVSDSEVSLGK